MKASEIKSITRRSLQRVVRIANRDTTDLDFEEAIDKTKRWFSKHGDEKETNELSELIALYFRKKHKREQAQRQINLF